MAQLRIYHVDAFAGEVFRGNPAAVCPLEAWLDDATMQAIAAENNLAETAFFVPRDGEYDLRWFTPRCEVDLCGHATLASAFVLFEELDTARGAVRFESRSGPLWVRRAGPLLALDLPAMRLEGCADPPDALLGGLGRAPVEVFRVDADPNYYAVYESEDDVRAIRPDLPLLESLHPYGAVATAPGRASDCASRYFAPGYGIPEDPVTGSIHCALVPYWARRLGRTAIRARQVSERGGELFCEDRGERVGIAGRAAKYLEGTIFVPEAP